MWLLNLYWRPDQAFLSHAMLDKIDSDCTIFWTTKGQLLKDMDYIGLQAGGVGLVFYNVFANEPNSEFKIVRAAAIMGAILPDIIDGVYSFLFPQKRDAKELLLPSIAPTNPILLRTGHSKQKRNPY